MKKLLLILMVSISSFGMQHNTRKRAGDPLLSPIQKKQKTEPIFVTLLPAIIQQNIAQALAQIPQN